MKLEIEIEILRRDLDNMLLNESNLCKNEILNVSRKLDTLILKYYLEMTKNIEYKK